MHSNIDNIVNKLTKPTSQINPAIFNSPDFKSMGINTTTNLKPTATNEKEKQISLWEFSRLYRIGQLPIIDFIVIYVVLYIINATYWHYNYKFVLIATIPIAIFFNILTNEQLKISGLIIIILIISIYFLVTININES